MPSYAFWLMTVMIPNTRNSSLPLLSTTKSHWSLSQADKILGNGLANANTRRVLKRELRLVKPEESEDAALFASETMVRKVMPKPSLNNISKNTVSEHGFRSPTYIS